MSGLAGFLVGPLAQVSGFESPLWLWLGIPAVVFGLWRLAARRPESLPWPALSEARAAGGRAHDPVAWLSLALRGGAALALLLALAEPRGPERTVRTRHDGLDLLLVMDASGSMRALDAQLEGEWRTRLELARQVVHRFALNRVAEGDRVGLVVFGDTAFTQCPLTLDGDLLGAALGRVEVGVAGESTALGDALALAVKRVAGAPLNDSGGPGDPGHPGDPEAGRVIVLLTDGRSNAGSVPTEVATALAVHHGTRVHTVGIGSRGEVAMSRAQGGRELRFERHDLDAATLQQIAGATGGRYFAARTPADLAAVYDAIDRLERTSREAPPRISGEPLPEPFLAAAGGLLLFELALARVLFRRIP